VIYITFGASSYLGMPCPIFVSRQPSSCSSATNYLQLSSCHRQNILLVVWLKPRIKRVSRQSFAGWSAAQLVSLEANETNIPEWRITNYTTISKGYFNYLGFIKMLSPADFNLLISAITLQRFVALLCVCGHYTSQMIWKALN